MLNFGRLLSYPLKFKNLTNRISQVQISNISIRYLEDHKLYNVSAIANGHQVFIQIYGDKISVKSPVKLYCDCDFFKYNLAYALYKQDSLLYPENFILTPPKKKNTSLTLSGCKHIILVAQSVWANKNIQDDA